jgi:hypothetical protein
VDGRLFILGGYGGAPENLLAVDLPTGEVRQLPAPPGFERGDHFHVLAQLDGQLHVVGGLDGEEFEPKAEHWILTDPAANLGTPPDRCWKAAKRPPSPVWAKFTVQAVAGNRLYLSGDFGAFCYDADEDKWQTIESAPATMVMPASVVTGDCVWVIGGQQLQDQHRQMRLLFRYDVANNSWSDHSIRDKP